MNIAKICIGCMNEIENKQQMKFCPKCGQNLMNIKADKHMLQPYMVLNEKYFVGKVIDTNENCIKYMGYALELDTPITINEFYPIGLVDRDTEKSTDINICNVEKNIELVNKKENFINSLKGQNDEIEIFEENGTVYVVNKFVEKNAKEKTQASINTQEQILLQNQTVNTQNQMPMQNNQAVNMQNQMPVQNNQAVNMQNQMPVQNNQAVNMQNQMPMQNNQSMNTQNQMPLQNAEGGKKKKTKNKNLFVRFVIGISIVCVIATMGILVYLTKEYLWDEENDKFVFSGFDKIINKSVDTEDSEDTTSETETEIESEKQEEKKTKYLEDMLQGKEYDKLIDEILNIDNKDLEEYKDEVNEILRQAIVGHQNICMNKVDEAVTGNELKGVYAIINAEIVYRQELAKKGAPEEFVSTDELYKKSDEIKPKYKQYIYQKTTECANNGDAESVDSLFKEADAIFTEDDEYNRKKEIIYGKLVSTKSLMLDASNGSRAAMDYINENLHLTSNNVYCMELWDVYDHKLGGGGYQITTPNVKKNGYLLSGSDTRLISESELDKLSRYEVYLAMFEIYARHGRKFTDTMVTDFFSKHSWYSGTIEPSNFDETCLNQTEIDNINTIVNYRKSKGWFGY